MSCRFHKAYAELYRLESELTKHNGDMGAEEIAWGVIGAAKELIGASCSCEFDVTNYDPSNRVKMIYG